MAAALRPVPVSFMRGADRLGRDDQVRWQDQSGREDGHPRCRSPRHRRVHLVQGTSRSARHACLRDAGFDMDLDGKDSQSIQYQNANNSVRVTDEFMQAVLDDSDWELLGRHVRRGHRDHEGTGSVPPDRQSRLGVRRSRHAVRHDHKQMAHGPNTGRINAQ